MNFLQSLIMFLGRICLSAIFLSAAYSKIINWDATVTYMASKGMTNIPLFLAIAIVVEGLGGLFVLLGYRARLGAAMLLALLIPATVIFHNFWALTGVDHELQSIMFLKNVAIIGGLLQLLAVGSGKIGFDACGCKAPAPSVK